MPLPHNNATSSRASLTTLPVDADDWDELVLRFDDAVQEQLQSFYDAAYPTHRTERFAFYDKANKNELVGAALVRRLPAPIPGLSVFQIERAPLWRLAGKTPDPSCVPRLIQAVKDAVLGEHGGILLMLPRTPPEACPFSPALLKQLGFKEMTPSPSPERYFVDVSGSADKVRKSFHQKTRAHVKKSEKMGLTAAFEDTPEGFDIFFQLYQQMVGRKGLLDYAPVEAIRARIAAKEERARPKIMIVRHEDTPVAGAVLDCLGDHATYLYGATSAAALPLKAGFFMQWTIVQYLCSEPQINWYDLIGANSKTSSLHQFKRGLVGRDGVIGTEVPFFWTSSGLIWGPLGELMIEARRLKRALKLRYDSWRHNKSLN